ncbi:MAG TPA: YlbF family regulator [Gemmatimonadaceae bacterium]|jgi:cell fate (sporulation/competence/biofilm development) regulator YlbF (YheA/YmcA/DUF963 family)
MIEDKGKELGRLIGQSQEYQTLKRASDALNEDKETVALLQQMEKLRVDAQRALAKGERPTPEMERQLDTLLGQIQGRSSYQRLLVAQENFDKVMQRVNDWIMEGIERGATSSIITLG